MGCTATTDSNTGVTTITTSSITYSGVTSYPMGVRLVASRVSFSSTADVSFCIPSTRSGYLTIITTTSSPINMDGKITLNVGNVVPTSITLLSSTNVANDTQWAGVFQSVTAVLVSSIVTSSPPCFNTFATPTYNAFTVSIALSQSNTGGALCLPALTGLSGGAIAGIVIGAIVGAALLAILVIFLMRKIDFDSKRQLFSRTKIHAAESSVPM